MDAPMLDKLAFAFGFASLRNARAMQLLVLLVCFAGVSGCLGEPLSKAQVGVVETPDIVTADAGTDAVTPGTDAVTAECTKDSDCNDPGPCQRAICNPSGKCENKNDDKETCSDNNVCTVTDACVSGKCAGTGAKDCNDNNACTADSCDPTAGCKNLAETNGKACDDGDKCNTDDNCQEGKCKGGTPVDCSDGNACTKDECEPAGGCKNPNELEGLACGDGKGCVPEECKSGVCKPVGACECLKDSDCVAKLDNGDLCDGSFRCDIVTGQANKCVATAAPICTDSNPIDCIAVACEKSTGQCKEQKAKIGSVCDLDDIPCTEDVCNSQGQCEFNVDTCGCGTPSAPECKSDGNPCNGVEYCNKKSITTDGQLTWSCDVVTKNIPKCDKVTDCAYEQCNATTGKCDFVPFAETNKACDDGNGCTAGDYCDAGECLTSANICSCTQDSDCAKEEDGDLCNGTLFCNKVEGECQINPKTVVSCQSGNNTDCLLNICEPNTGVCSLFPRERLEPKPSCTETDKAKCPLVPKPESEGSAQILCDDGNPCTAVSQCSGGSCQVGENSFLCTCTKDSDCAKGENGDVCDGVLYCDVSSGKCLVNPATIVSCNEDLNTECRRNTCDPLTGACSLVAEPDNKACDDGNPCSLSAICTGGVCKQDSASNGCSCVNDGDCVSQEDGNLCNGTLYCDKTAGKCQVNPATIKTCIGIDDSYCERNQCDPKTGECQITDVNTYLACDDGNPCTALGTCLDGSCTAGANLCECQQDTDCGSKEDGNLCNGTLYCDTTEGKCKVNPSTVPFCSPVNDTDCSLNTCDPKTGVCAQKFKPLFAPCDDGNVCTSGDTCDTAGLCTAGSFLCQCSVDDDCATFETNACAGEFFCDKTSGEQFQCKIKPNSVITCSQDGVQGCVVNQCNPADGLCGAVQNGFLCNDGNPCTADSCKVDGSCDQIPVSNGVPCGAGTCQAGVCKVGP
jgi:hypothetical protein